MLTKGMSASDKDTGTSMVYGFIDSTETDTSLYKYSIAKKETRNGVSEYEFYDTRTADNGMFYLEDLEPGEYLLSKMHAKSYPIFGEPYYVTLPDGDSGKEFALATVKITKPGIYYMGTYKIYVMKNQTFGHSEILSTRSEVSPSEDDILKQILPHLKGTGWDKDVAKRLKEIKG